MADEKENPIVEQLDAVLDLSEETFLKIMKGIDGVYDYASLSELREAIQTDCSDLTHKAINSMVTFLAFVASRGNENVDGRDDFLAKLKDTYLRKTDARVREHPVDLDARLDLIARNSGLARLGELIYQEIYRTNFVFDMSMTPDYRVFVHDLKGSEFPATVVPTFNLEITYREEKSDRDTVTKVFTLESSDLEHLISTLSAIKDEAILTQDRFAKKGMFIWSGVKAGDE